MADATHSNKKTGGRKWRAKVSNSLIKQDYMALCNVLFS